MLGPTTPLQAEVAEHSELTLQNLLIILHIVSYSHFHPMCSVFPWTMFRQRSGLHVTLSTGNHLIHDRRYRHASRRPRATSNRR